jgi:hypothetical protein
MNYKKWFELQFGKRPCGQKLHILKSNRESTYFAFNKANDLYDRTSEWDRKFNDCMYAWNMKDEEKK